MDNQLSVEAGLQPLTGAQRSPAEGKPFLHGKS